MTTESDPYPATSSVYPPGAIAGEGRTLPLTSHRYTRFTFELLEGQAEVPRGDLLTVRPGGTLAWNSGDKIKGGGKITVMDTGQADVDWLSARVRITCEVNGTVQPLGVWVPTAPKDSWAGGYRSWDVELHDKLSVLDEDSVTETFTLPAGTVVTDAVRSLIEGAGETNISMTDSDATLANPMVWEAGTTLLTIVNNLLDASGYFTLRTDMNGAYVVREYVGPSNRPLSYTFEDGATCIYLDAFTVDQDIFSVPNRVVAVGQGSDDSEGLVGVAENVDPESPYSYPSRGRWITKVMTGVEATDQAAIDTYAYSTLVDNTTPTRSVDISHAPVWLDVLDAVWFKSSASGDDGLFVGDKTEVSLDPTGLSKSTIRKVVQGQ